MSAPLRMTAAEYRARQASEQVGGGKSRQNKYNAKKTRVDGITFDSKHEANRYSSLMLLKHAGKIQNLSLQVRFKLRGADGEFLRSDSGRTLVYVADFVYGDVESGKTVIEDAKGVRTPEYRLKKAAMASMGYEIVEV